MLLALIYGFARFVLDLLLIRRGSDQSLRLEVLALRHQLPVLERQVGRPRWQTADRLLLAALSRHLPRPDWRTFLVTPETLLRWHRELVRRKWAFFTRRRQRLGGPSWRPNSRRWSFGWRARIRVGAIAASRGNCANWDGGAPMEPCGSSSGGRGCRPRPSGPARNLAWTLQSEGRCPKFLLRDRDAKFPAAFDAVFRSEGMEIIRIPFRAPRANAFAERWVGTIRREALDDLLIFGRRHLEHVLREFVDHYQHARPHQSLGQQVPAAPLNWGNQRAGPVVRRDRLGGLIHEYSRAA